MGNSQFQIFGTVVLDTADATGKTQQISRAIGGMGQSAAGAAPGFDGLTAAQNRSTQSAMLLAAQFGVHLPRSVAKFVGMLPGIGIALTGAFSAIAVYTLIDAVTQAAEKSKWFMHLFGMMTKRERDAEEKAGEAIGAAKDFISKKESDLLILRARGIDKIREEGKVALDALYQEHDLMGIANRDRKARALQVQEEINQEKEHQGLVKLAREQATEMATLAMHKAEVTATAEEKIRLQLAETVRKTTDLERQGELSHHFAEQRRVAATAGAEEEIRELRRKNLQKVADDANEATKTFEDAMKAIRVSATGESLKGIAKIEFDRQQEIIKIDKAAADELQKIQDARILDAEHMAIAVEEIEKQKAEAITAINIAAQRRELEDMAARVESFIDRTFMHARSLSDVFHQFLMQLLGSFVKWISQMLASWLTGIRQVTAGGGGAGILGSLGSILGGVFGLGGGTSAMAAPAGVTAQAGQLGLPIGMGGMALSGGGGIPSAVGGAGAGTLGQLAFGGKGLAGLSSLISPGLVLGGIALAGGSAGPVRGALGGALVGGGIGLGLYSLGLLGGPWGLVLAGIGAAIGGLVGLFRRGGQKKKASGLQQGFEFAANDLFDQFEQFKIDYDSALAGMQELITQGQQTLTSAALGRWGRQGAEGLTHTIQDEIRALQALEKQREARATLMAGMTIPEFAIGGAVGYRLPTGGIPAIVHPGEFVIRREAVDALGANFLAGLNRVPRFASGGPVSPSSPLTAGQQGGIHVHGDLILYPAKDMTDREAMRMVVRGFNRAVRDGAL
jgi:hypothetical protein